MFERMHHGCICLRDDQYQNADYLATWLLMLYDMFNNGMRPKNGPLVRAHDIFVYIKNTSPDCITRNLTAIPKEEKNTSIKNTSVMVLHQIYLYC